MTPKPSENFSQARILLVEDEALILMDLEGMLADMGCRKITSVASVEAAMAAVSRQSFQLAILDIHLADGDSYEVAASLMANDIPFIFVSGSEGDEVPGIFSKVPFVTKPFDVSSLEENLRNALSAANSGLGYAAGTNSSPHDCSSAR